MLTFEFIPYNEIASLSSDQRIAKVLALVKEEKIVLLEGRLKKEEEANLIQKTMESIDKQFKGIELGVIYPGKEAKDFLEKLRKMMIRFVLGNRQGFTIIGPATLIKEIKRDPNKIQLFTTDIPVKKKKRASK